MAFESWKQQARKHWHEFQPKMFKELLQSGKLEAALEEASELTYREVTALEDAGYDPQAAWEMVREKYLFLPAAGSGPSSATAA